MENNIKELTKKELIKRIEEYKPKYIYQRYDGRICSIEEAIEILKDNIKSLEGHTSFKHTNYKKVQAIETLLTAYEKEKNKKKQ